MNADWIAISANRDEPSGENSGSVYLYRLDENIIVEEQKIFPADGDFNDYFGKSISLYGEWLAISSVYDNDNGNKSGSVYIYHLSNNYWIEYSKIVPIDGLPYDRFGYCLDIYANTLAVGSVFDDDLGENAGSVYIYSLDNNEWVFSQKIYANINNDDNNFGIKLSIYDDIVAVSSINADVDYLNQGLVDIFSLHSDGIWSYDQTILSLSPNNYDYFGISIDVYKNIIAVGAYFDDQINNNSGAVYLYEKISNNWIPIDNITSIDAYANDNFGLSLSVYDDWLVVGSIDDDNGINSGSAYIYHKENDEYIEKIKILPSDGSEYDEFSSSIYLNENNLIVGSKYDDDMGTDSGSAYLFTYKGCTDINACNNDSYILTDNNQCIFPQNGFDCYGICYESIDYCEVCGGNGSNGDANVDGSVNVIDITLIVNYILNDSPINICTVDLNQNSIINITDLIILIENILND